MEKIAAIIPAAGYSSRMGLYKPLLPLGEINSNELTSLVLEKTIKTFLEAGIENIYVVTGHHASLLKPITDRLGVEWVKNTNFRQGMYSSVMAGAEVLTEETDAFFLLPADIPLVLPDTIKQLVTSYRQKPCDVIFPVCEGKKGHPPLISKKLRPAILQGEAEGGLKTLLHQAADTRCLYTDDFGILRDLDTEEVYRSLLTPELAQYPTKEECEQILKAYQVPQPVILHAQQVARLAGMIALYLNSYGHRLHLALLQSACLLHDIAKGEPQHAIRGKQLVEAMGFAEVASLIAAHMDLPDEYVQQINEYSLLFLADKMVKGSEYVTLEKRKTEKIHSFQGNPAAQQSASERLDKALRLQKTVENLIHIPLAAIAGGEL